MRLSAPTSKPIAAPAPGPTETPRRMRGKAARIALAVSAAGCLAALAGCAGGDAALKARAERAETEAAALKARLERMGPTLDALAARVERVQREASATAADAAALRAAAGLPPSPGESARGRAVAPLPPAEAGGPVAPPAAHPAGAAAPGAAAIDAEGSGFLRHIAIGCFVGAVLVYAAKLLRRRGEAPYYPEDAPGGAGAAADGDSGAPGTEPGAQSAADGDDSIDDGSDGGGSGTAATPETAEDGGAPEATEVAGDGFAAPGFKAYRPGAADDGETAGEAAGDAPSRPRKRATRPRAE